MRYMLVVAFLLLSLSSSALAISTDPFGMAEDISKYTSCIISTVFRLTFILLILGVVVLLIHKFVQIERLRQTGRVYMDELISLFALGFALALVIRLVAETLFFFGIPVKYIIYDVLYCNPNFAGKVACKKFLDTPLVEACAAIGFGDIPRFVLQIAVGLARLFLIFIVVFAIFIAGGKIFYKQYQLYKDRKQSGVYSVLKASVDFMVLLIVVLLFTYGVYGLIFVDHAALTAWFFDTAMKKPKQGIGAWIEIFSR